LRWVVPRHRFIEIALVLLIIAAAVYRRLEYVTERSFWVDEAESSINALTILDHGVPINQYLGIPIYENTLIKAWPGNPEYEFKDISYSDRGLATYHGWLPLYSIAASFALHHVAPDHVASGSAPHRTLEDFKRRTRIARLPSVLFRAVFLGLCYWGAVSLLGHDAGVTALLVGCVHKTQLDFATTARYYSATVALSTAAVLCLWLILTKGQWKHYAIAAGVYTLLFYTHTVTFASGIFVFLIIAVYLMWKKRDSIPKLLMFGGFLILMTVPWIIATGFLSGLGSVPPARLLLSFPKDLVTFPLIRPQYSLFFGAFFLAALCTWSRLFRLPDRVQVAVRDCLPAVVLLSLWMASGYASFMLFIPAASFFPERLNLGYWGPGLLLGSVFCAWLSRMFTRRFAIVAAPLLAFFLMWLTGLSLRVEPTSDGGRGWNSLVSLAQYLDHQEIRCTTKLYASPNEHLNLAFYTGRPFQSIAPVRKSFLDSYRGDIVYVERVDFLPRARFRTPVTPKRIDGLAGPSPGETEGQRLSDLLRTLPYRREVNEDILGAPDVLDSFLPMQARGAILGEQESDKLANTFVPMFRGYKVENGREWRDVFSYRFADPASHSGKHANYAERIRGSRADLLTDSGWAIYCSKFHDPAEMASVDFRVLP
jgi:hypothetical protein